MTDALVYEDEMIDPEALAFEEELRRLRNINPIPLKKMVDEFRDGTSVSDQIGKKGRRYYDGDQLDEPMLKALRRARQPRVVRNEIKPAVNGLLGLLQQAKVDPKAFPRNPDNEEQANVATKALRFVGDINRFHKTKIDAAETFLIEGVAAAMVGVDEKNNPLISLIREDEWIYDPRSRNADFSDAAYKGIGKWYYEGDIAAMYPHFAADLAASYSSGWGNDLGLDRIDKPNEVSTNWLDAGKRRIFVCELYHREDDGWMRSVFYVGGVLEQGPSPYLDEDGQSTCPIVMGSCFIDTDNQRYGVVRSMLSPQDELNAYSSRALHLANSRQIQAASAEFPPEVDAETAKREAAKPDGALPPGWQPVPTTDLMAGIQLMIGEARQALIRQAPTPAVLSDAASASASGRAKLVAQQAGMTETARAFGRLEDWELMVFNQSWLRLKQFKDEPWFIRITGNEGKQEFVGVNQPVGPDGQPIPPQMAQMMAMQGIPVQMMNNLAEMNVDIEIESVPDTANLAAEQFEALAPMLPMLAQAIGPEPAFKVGLALSSISDKPYVLEIIDAARGTDDPQAQQMAQMQQQMEQMAQQLQMMGAEARVRLDNASAGLKEAQAANEQADAVGKAASFAAFGPQPQ